MQDALVYNERDVEYSGGPRLVLYSSATRLYGDSPIIRSIALLGCLAINAEVTSNLTERGGLDVSSSPICI